MRILLIDDHQLFSAGLSILLEELATGTHITSTNTIAKALQVSGSFDLILLDLHLPDANGFEGLTILKNHFEASPIVVISSEENPQRIRDSIQHGAMGFVPKTSSPEELFRAMQLILSGETYLPPMCIAPLDKQAMCGANALQLSPRQHEVLMKVVQGKPNKIIAREMGISDQTVKSHVMAVLSAMKVNNRTEAVYKAASLGITTKVELVIGS